jgi:hypothetical protein
LCVPSPGNGSSPVRANSLIIASDRLPLLRLEASQGTIYGAGKVRRKKCLINRAPTSFTHWMSA